MVWYKLATTRDFTLAEARAAAKQKFAEVRTGRDPMAEKRAERNAGRDAESFAALAEKFIEYAKEQTKPRTAREYERPLRQDIIPVWGKRKAAEIKDVMTLADAKKAKGTPVIANRLLATISALFCFAVDREIVAAHPATNMRRSRTPEESRDQVLSPEEIRLLWPQFTAPLRLLLLTGARRNLGEAVAKIIRMPG